MGVKRGSERNRYAGNRSNFATRRTGPCSGVRDVINVSQTLLNPRCAPSIPQRPSRSVPYSINTLKRCSDEADGQTGFTGMGAIPAIHPRRNGHRSRHARGRTRKAPPMAPEAHPAQNGSKSCSHGSPNMTLQASKRRLSPASFGKPRRATGTRCSHGRVSCQKVPR